MVVPLPLAALLAFLVHAVTGDDLVTTASRRTLSRFEKGHVDNTHCWDREGADGFYTVIDTHNHFRYDIQLRKPCHKLQTTSRGQAFSHKKVSLVLS
jgi:hypothetical protein